MPEGLSKSQIDKLGERLKSGAPTDEDLILLDQFRQSFAEAYESAFKAVSSELKKNYPASAPRGREAKTKESIIAKLKRGSTKLSQMQDIVGCRVVVPTALDQAVVIESLRGCAPGITRIVDRRVKPSSGYRAVHLISEIAGKQFETQVRTRFQHLWAANSERLAIRFHDPSIKYGWGDDKVRIFLATFSKLIETTEVFQLGRAVDEIGGASREITDLKCEEKHLNRAWIELAERFGTYGENLLYIPEDGLQ